MNDYVFSIYYLIQLKPFSRRKCSSVVSDIPNYFGISLY